jgi:hypothetical protein
MKIATAASTSAWVTRSGAVMLASAMAMISAERMKSVRMAPATFSSSSAVSPFDRSATTLRFCSAWLGAASMWCTFS